MMKSRWDFFRVFASLRLGVNSVRFDVAPERKLENLLILISTNMPALTGFQKSIR